MTEQELAQFNDHVCKLPVIEDLKRTDKEIIDDLEGLKNGQNELLNNLEKHETANKAQFEKGAARMSGIEGELKEMKSAMHSQHSQIMAAIAENRQAIRDKAFDDMKAEIRRRDEELKKKEEADKEKRQERSNIKVGVISTAITSLLALIAWLGSIAFAPVK